MAEEANLAIEQYDREELWRCPMLGGPVHFGYCRKMNEGLPCSKLLECWLQRLPLVDFLKTHYSPDEIQAAFSTKRKGRLTRMLETIERTTPNEAPNPERPHD